MPVGYVLNSALFGSVEVAYNVFETYRGGEAGFIYGRLLAVPATTCSRPTPSRSIPTSSAATATRKGWQSGAWWFYQKLGFRARDPRRAEADARAS